MLKGGKASFVSSHSLFRCFQFLLLCLPHLHLTCREIKHGISHLTRSCMHAHIEQEASITWSDRHTLVGSHLHGNGESKELVLSLGVPHFSRYNTLYTFLKLCVCCVCVCVYVCVFMCV